MNEQYVIIFFWLAFMMYAGAFVLYGYHFASKKHLLGTLATVFALLGLTFHTLSLAARWQSVGYLPLQGAFEFFFLMAWALAIVYLIVERFTSLQMMGMVIMPFIVVLMGISWNRYESVARLDQSVKNSWIVMHVSVVFLSYAAFSLAAVAAVFYLAQERQLKTKNTSLIFRRLPSLQTLDNLEMRTIIIAQVLMTMTIITGIIRAVKDIPLWYIDSIVVSTTISWIIYDVVLAARYVWDWQGKRVAYMSLLGFGLIVFIALVIKYYPTALHTLV